MKKRKHIFINGTKGFISLLVLVTLLPFYSLAALLEESGRYQASTKTTDEAVSNAAVSTLGNYDDFLLKRFGLTAVSQKDSSADPDDRDFMEKTFKKYLLAQQLQGTKSFDISADNISVGGVYPLGDVNALEEEVVQYSAIRIPVQAGEDLLDLDELIGNLEKDSGVCKVLGLVNSGVDLVDKYTDVYTTMNGLKDKIDKFQETDKNYKKSYDDWKNAVKEYKDYEGQCENDDDNVEPTPSENETEEEKQAREEAEEAKRQKKEEEEKKLQELRNNVETKKSAFQNATGIEFNGLNSIDNVIQKATKSFNDAQDKTVGFTHDAANFAIEKKADAATDNNQKSTGSDEDQKKTQEQKDYEDAVQVVKDNGKTIEDTVYNGYSDTVNDANNIITQNYSNDDLTACLKALDKNKKDISSYDDETMPGDDLLVDCSEFTDSRKIQEFINEAENSTDLNNIITYLNNLCSAVASIFELNFLYDPELNTTIDVDYFNSLPSKRNDNRQALNNPNAERDEEMAQRFIESYAPGSIDQYTRVKDMSGLQQAITKVVNQVPIFVGCGLKLKTNMNIFTLLPLLREFFESGITLVTDILKVQECMDEVDASSTEIMSMIRSRIGRRALVMGYLTYSLSNRTTYKSFTSEGGLSNETDESPAESMLRINYPDATEIFGMMFNNPTSGKSFAGCELEYICAGNASERMNQVQTTNMIYGVRMIMDLVSIFTNKEFMTILDSFCAAAPLGTLIGLLYALVVVVGEPALDTLFLANDAEEPFYKTTIYLTPTGLISLCKDLVNITILGDNELKDEKEKLKKQVESLESKGMPGNSSGESGTQNTTDTSGKGNVSSGKGSKISPQSKLKEIGTNALENVNKISYTQHCLLMMVLAGDYYQYLKRLQDIIQMESWQYAHYTGSDAKQRATGNYDNFDIDKAYTCLRIEVSGTFNPVLPVPKLTDQQLLLNYHRVMYRGY